MRRGLIVVGGSLLVVLIATLVFVYSQPYTFRGSVIQPADTALDFTLQDGQDQPYQLSQQQGKVVLVFFGYTNCPDACPATFSTFKQVKTRLEGNAKDVQFVLITVDPRRDTPQKVGQYVAAFDPSFIGLSGSEQALAPVWKGYGVYRAVPENPDTDVYPVEHSTVTYVIDKKGNLRETFSLGTPADDIVQDVRYLVKE